MMRIGLLAVVLGLSACAVHDGHYPTYRVGDETAYDRYRGAREAALLSGKAPPSVIPVTLPVKAPTAEEIRAANAKRIVIGTPAARPAAPADVVTAPAATPAATPAAADAPLRIVPGYRLDGTTP